MSEEITQTPSTANEEGAQPEAKAEETRPEKSVLFNEEGMPPDDDDETPPSSDTEPEGLTEKDITIPDGYEYEPELGNSFLDIINDQELSRKDLAQKLFDLYQSQNLKMLEGLKAAETERVKKFKEELAAEKAEWVKACEGDKEYGGQKWEASQAVINRGCEHLATPEAVRIMQAYNLNTHPEIVRMFYRAGLLAGEDKSQAAGGVSGKPTDPAMAIFGESLKEYHKRKGDIE